MSVLIHIGRPVCADDGKHKLHAADGVRPTQLHAQGGRVKLTFPLWPILLMLVGSVIVGLIIGAPGPVLAGFVMATAGWMGGLAEAASRSQK